MAKETRNRYIHVAGLVLCLVALYLAGSGTGAKSVITATIAGLGLIGNAYGVWRPTTWLR